MKKGIPSRRAGMFVALTLGCVWLGSPALAEIHKWVDENGVVHFSDTKPADKTTQTIEIQDGSDATASFAPAAGGAADAPASGEVPSTAQARREKIAETRRLQQEKSRETERWCEKHRARLAQMEPARRAYYKDEKGELVRMDDDQRVGLVEESREFLARNCQ
jgi:hypothetical protein